MFRNTLIILFIFFIGCKTDLNTDLISLCTPGKDTLMIRYMNSTYGIKVSQKTIKADTLCLQLKTAYRKSPEILMQIPPEVSFVKIDTRIFEFKKLDNCVRALSGDKANEFLRKIR